MSLIQPYAPHVAEELWSRLGHERLWAEPWPVADESQLERDEIELVLQVNGKVRDRIQVAAGLPEDELIALAKASEKVQAHLDGQEPRVDRRAGQARQSRRVAPAACAPVGRRSARADAGSSSFRAAGVERAARSSRVQSREARRASVPSVTGPAGVARRCEAALTRTAP